jgi:O-antigen/teichoic acid export membrane protein
LHWLVRITGKREISALGDQALVSGANFATSVILARVLGVREYGVLALAWVAVLFVNSLQYAFIVSPMVSVGPKQEPAERPLYYGSVLAQEIMFAVVSAVALGIAVRLSTAHFPQWNVHGLEWPLSCTALAYLMQDFVRRYLFSVRKSQLALASDAISYLTQLPIISFMSHDAHFSSQAALWVIAATSLAGFATGCCWFESVQLRFSALKKVFVRHWKISRWLAPSALMQWSSGNLFVIAAPIYYGAAAAGILRAVQNIVGVAHIWFLGLDNVVPAEAARLMHSQGLEASFNYIKQVVRRWGTITLIFVLVVAARPEFWLRLVYGMKYAGYGYVLQLYAAVYLLVFFAGPLRASLQALEYTTPMFWSYSAMTVFSVLFAGPFAKRLGLTGVLLGMIGAQLLFQGIVGLWLLLRVRGMRRDVLSEVGIRPMSPIDFGTAESAAGSGRP